MISWLAEYKGSRGCITCGNKDHKCLVFHHRDPATKKFQVGLTAWARTKKSILEEASKCDVMCANCHQILHYKRK